MEQEQLTSFISYLRNERRYSELTIRAYVHDITQFGFFLNNHRLPQATDQQTQASEQQPPINFEATLVQPDDVKRWVMALNNADYKATSVNRRISSLRSFFRYLCKQKLVAVNPCTSVSNLKRERRLPEFIEPTKMDTIISDILNYQGDDFEPTRDSLIILLFFTLGMRLAELTSIYIGDFNDHLSEIKIKGKGDKERLLPLLPVVTKKIKHYLHLREQVILTNNNNIDKKEYKTCNPTKELLLLTNKATALSQSQVYRIVHKLLSQAGVSGKRSPHILRHTFATYMLNQGADVRTIQEILGHASLDATQIYTHNNISRLKQVYQNAHPRSKLKT